eukprot:TRINITY_DN12759_c0_g1_i1.p1 TRINITY_DN12759_c0_g1~~TRINITY_DN12759_c0_g1_i1.p1  ORF type:complete len:251 (+),score=53.55 TRINITY_DN12759_c0_g1_i1:58-753(+)
MSAAVSCCFSLRQKQPKNKTTMCPSTAWRRQNDMASECILIAKLGPTIQGAVYKGIHVETAQDVAVKVLSKKAVAKRSSLNGKLVAENIFDEVSILSRLQGIDGVIELVDTTQDDEYFYIVTKFEQNGDLLDLVKSHLLDEAHIRHVFRSTCQAVLRIHEAGVCHLDLSLENVFVSEDNSCKIGDFGVARYGRDVIIDGPLEVRVGKIAYMAPEMVSNEGGVTGECLCFRR